MEIHVANEDRRFSLPSLTKLFELMQQLETTPERLAELLGDSHFADLLRPNHLRKEPRAVMFDLCKLRFTIGVERFPSVADFLAKNPVDFKDGAGKSQTAAWREQLEADIAALANPKVWNSMFFPELRFVVVPALAESNYVTRTELWDRISQSLCTRRFKQCSLLEMLLFAGQHKVVWQITPFDFYHPEFTITFYQKGDYNIRSYYEDEQTKLNSPTHRINVDRLCLVRRIP